MPGTWGLKKKKKSAWNMSVLPELRVGQTSKQILRVESVTIGAVQAAKGVWEEKQITLPGGVGKKVLEGGQGGELRACQVKERRFEDKTSITKGQGAQGVPRTSLCACVSASSRRLLLDFSIWVSCGHFKPNGIPTPHLGRARFLFKP